MNKTLKFLDIKNYNFHLIIGFFYLITIICFFLNLDPNGGAYLDYLNQKRISQEFAKNFFDEFLTFDQETTRHSPVLLIILSFLERINLPDIYIRLVAFHFCMLLPFFFYKLIKLRFDSLGNQNILLLTCLIFLSPTFISLSVWPDSRIYGVIFFTISLIYFSKFELENKKNNLGNAIKCTFWYAIATYFSLNFALFSIFFILKFLNFFKFNKEFLYIFVLNMVLALPAIIYTFSLETLFFLKSGISSKEFSLKDNLNFSNKVLMISSIILFYLLPFIFTKLVKIDYLNFKDFIISILIVLFCIVSFNYGSNFSGGGIFFKSSHLLFNSNIPFFIISIFSIMTVLSLSKTNIYNALIIILLISSNIQFSIYHKYYDPLLFILFFSIFDIKLSDKKIKKIKLSYFYLFFTIFLSLNYLKQLL